ncbi:MAG: hypothetical protein AB7R69_01635 [Candidatus Babeliales bacterium]
MKKLFLMGMLMLTTTLIQSEKHIILPRQFHVGQEFVYEGIPYIIKGYDHKKSADFEKVTLVLEHPLSFGLEFGTEVIELTIKHGKDPEKGILYNTHVQNRYNRYHVKTYILGLWAALYFFTFNVKLAK